MADEHEAHPSVNYTLIFAALCVFTLFSVLADVYGKDPLGRKILAAKSATVFDARPFKEYAVSHIPGATCCAISACLLEPPWRWTQG